MATIVANHKMELLRDPEDYYWALKSAYPKNRRPETEIVICPGFLDIGDANKSLQKSDIQVGAQNVFWEASGAFTGEVSGIQLQARGVTHVIITHSERRRLFRETEATAIKKALALLRLGLKPIICVGEEENTRNKSDEAAEKFVKQQVAKILKGIPKEFWDLLVFAYEPRWAIGTGRTPTEEQIASMMQAIKTVFHGPVLYGGSVNAENIVEIAEVAPDGVLVGKASLIAKVFIAIIEAYC